MVQRVRRSAVIMHQHGYGMWGARGRDVKAVVTADTLPAKYTFLSFGVDGRSRKDESEARTRNLDLKIFHFRTLAYPFCKKPSPN
jgi:hypothetical protein